MLSTVNLGKSYGARTLFAGVSLTLNPGCRYGLVGANGAGKTTLLNILTGAEPASEGRVNIPVRARVGVLRQDRFLNDDEPIVSVACQGDAVVWEALQGQHAAAEAEDAHRIAELDETIRAHDGYTLEARASAILAGLGIPAHLHRQPLGVLSGGMKLRVLLAQALLGGADLLLLDEPTNHLDIVSIRWLEGFLSGYRGCAVVISHDRRFLDTVATHTLDVDYGTVTVYTGNYSTFERDKAAARARKESEVANAEALIAHKQAYVDRFRAKASKASQAQSILKQIDKIEVEELAQSSRRAASFAFTPRRPSGRDVLSLDGVYKSYGDKRVLQGVSLTLRRGERLGVIGPNGLGKSTLLRVAVGRTPADAGTVTWGHEVRVGYFSQDHREVLDDPDARVLDVAEAARPEEGVGFARKHLGRMLFSGDDALKRVGALSGGEAARVVFCRLMMEQPNVLVLDEPTNHLDIESIDTLTAALAAYDGTVLFVSHDRAFVSAVATRILELTPDGPREFPGTYEEYLARSGDDHLDGAAATLRVKREQAAAKAATPAPVPTLSRDELKRRKALARQLTAQRDKAFAAVETAEARLAALHARMAGEGFYTRTPAAEVDALVAEEAALAPKIAALMAEWERLEAECTALGDDATA